MQLDLEILYSLRKIGVQSIKFEDEDVLEVEFTPPSIAELETNFEELSSQARAEMLLAETEAKEKQLNELLYAHS